jgi:hypothetical protein
MMFMIFSLCCLMFMVFSLCSMWFATGVVHVDVFFFTFILISDEEDKLAST